jgi:hypothetical protein
MTASGRTLTRRSALLDLWIRKQRASLGETEKFAADSPLEEANVNAGGQAIVGTVHPEPTKKFDEAI